MYQGRTSPSKMNSNPDPVGLLQACCWFSVSWLYDVTHRTFFGAVLRWYVRLISIEPRTDAPVMSAVYPIRSTLPIQKLD